MFKTLLKLFEMTFYGSGSVSVPRNRKKDGFGSVPVPEGRFRFGFRFHFFWNRRTLAWGLSSCAQSIAGVPPDGLYIRMSH